MSYTYPGRDRPAVADADLRIGAGEIVALVGENGSGMTTLTKLIAALYLPTEGTTQWDRIDARELEPADVHRSVAVIFQDFVRYQLTALESIARRAGVGRRRARCEGGRAAGRGGGLPRGIAAGIPDRAVLGERRRARPLRRAVANGWRWRGPFVAMPRS